MSSGPQLSPYTSLSLADLASTQSPLETLTALPKCHILNTHSNPEHAIALMVEYIHTRLIDTTGYGLSLVQSSDEADAQQRSLNNISPSSGGGNQVKTLKVINRDPPDWQSILTPSTLIFLSPQELLALSLNANWAEGDRLPTVVFIANLQRLPLNFLSLLHPFTRVLLWKDNQIQFIITAYISNYQTIAAQFFGVDGKYIHVK